MSVPYKLFKIQLPEERRVDEYATTGLETYLKTRYSKNLWYSSVENAVLLDIPEIVDEFYSTVQRLCELPSGGYTCHLSVLDNHNLSVEEKEWLDNRHQIRRELCDQVLHGYKRDLIHLDIHLLTLEKSPSDQE